MKFKVLSVLLLLGGLWPSGASADNRFIVRSTLDLQTLQTACNPPLLTPICTVVRGLGDPLGQLFLITSPLNLGDLLNLPGNPLGIVRAEVDQLLNLFPVGALNVLPSPLPAGLMADRTPVPYPDSGGTVWTSYQNQPAAQIVRVSDAQSQFGVSGAGIVADIDTGVDPTHPALQSVLLPGYDFTRNQPGGSELTDISSSSCPFTSCPPPPCPSCSSAQVNQSTAAVLDQSTAAVLDGNDQYAAFGHGTMVMGVIHLVAPTAQLLPLKTFKADGTGFLSDILQAVYYAVQNNANVINMSFDTQTSSPELEKALDYAKQNNVICAASAGNQGQAAPPLTVYPAEWQDDVIGVASTSDQDTRSSFSNYGNAIVWVAAPGEAIVTTYPFGTYAAGWGTSFSAPFVSGAAALLLNKQANTNESQAAAAVAHAMPVGPDMGNGRLDLVQTLAAVDVPPTGSIDSPSGYVFVEAGQSVFFSGSGTDPDGTVTAYSWSFPGGNPGSSNVATPGNVTYSTPGIFVATLTVTDNAGLNDPSPKTRTIIVLPAFSLLSTPSAATVPPGASANHTVTVVPGNTFTGTVSFSVEGLPSGATASFYPASLTGSGSTTLAVTTATTTPQGTYTLTIRGTSGTFSHSTRVTLVVNASDFFVSASPASAKIRRLNSGNYSLSVAAVQGFTGTVNLGVTGLPPFVTAVFSPPSIAGSGTSVLTLQVDERTPTGNYNLTLSATSGSLIRSASAILKVR